MVILLTRVKLSEWVRLQLPLVSSRTELLGNSSLSTESSDFAVLTAPFYFITTNTYTLRSPEICNDSIAHADDEDLEGILSFVLN